MSTDALHDPKNDVDTTADPAASKMRDRVVSDWDDAGIRFDPPADGDDERYAESPDAESRDDADAEAGDDGDDAYDESREPPPHLETHRDDSGQLVDERGTPVDEDGFPSDPTPMNTDEDDHDVTYPLPGWLTKAATEEGLMDEDGEWDDAAIEAALPKNDAEDGDEDEDGDVHEEVQDLRDEVAALRREVAELKGANGTGGDRDGEDASDEAASDKTEGFDEDADDDVEPTSEAGDDDQAVEEDAKGEDVDAAKPKSDDA